MKVLFKLSAFFLLSLIIVGCATTQKPAPVVERLPETKKAVTPKIAPATPVVKKATTPEKDWRPDSYIVKKGDTLYAIGLEFGFDYKEIAQWNDIQPPYTIKIGQALKLKTSNTVATPATPAATTESSGAVVTPIKTEGAVQAKPLDEPAPMAKPIETPAPKAAESPKSNETALAGLGDDVVDWGWPAQGKVVTGFSESAGLKGLDIAGTQGQPVLAAASGKVVYSGSSLRGYGKLVILKHNKTYLSAYGHNSQILVKEGADVTKGQKIAEMGSTDTDSVKLHFEIRKLGKPIDPASYLPAPPN